MIDGLPNDTPGRWSVGTAGGLIFVAVVAAVLAGALYWMLDYAASFATQQ